MFILQKLSRRSSSRHQIAIKGVENGVLLLPNNQYRMVIKTSSINFHLMSEKEQDVLIDAYRAFLNSLSFTIQIVQKVRTLDIDNYVRGFENRKDKESVEVYRHQINNYIRHMQSLIKMNNILSRQFYIVIAYSPKEMHTFSTAREQLINRLAVIERGLGNIGIHTQPLNSLELLDLFYSSYSANNARRQPLSKQIIELLRKNYF